LLTDADIPACIWEAAMVYEDSEMKNYRLCTYLKKLKTPDEAFTFKKLARVALLERVFSMVTKNKTKLGQV